MDSRAVLLYGGSLLMSLVAGDLAQRSELHVARADNWPEASRLLAENLPDVLIFDLTETCQSHVLPLLLTNPGLLLVGLDSESNRAVLLAGQEARSLTLGQIRDIIERKQLGTESKQRSRP